MTELEKMKSGQFYYAEDPELRESRNRCKRICREANLLPPEQNAERNKMFRQLFGSAGDNLYIEPSFWCDYGFLITVGDNFYVNHNCVILDCAPITFGDNVFIAPNCGFYTATHPLDAIQRREAKEYALPITVGNDVWIGGGVTVLPGVTIGSNCVIGAGSVVVHDIPDNSVAVGNPCKVIKTLDPIAEH